MNRWIFVVLLVFVTTPVQAARLEGRVVGVLAPADLVIQDKTNVKRRIRIVALGLPPEGHPRRAEALRELGRLSMNRTVKVETFGIAPGCQKGDVCATLGHPSFSGLNPSLVLLKSGLAFHDRSQMSEQSTTDRMLYTEAQTEAQKHRRGVWHDPATKLGEPTPEPAPRAVPPPPKKARKSKKPRKRAEALEESRAS